MSENRYKESHIKTPVENHATAAWADSERLKEVSRVNMPAEAQVMEAKEYVDENHK